MNYTSYHKYILAVLFLSAFQPAQSFGIPTFIKKFATKMGSYFAAPKKAIVLEVSDVVDTVPPAQVLADLKDNKDSQKNNGTKDKVRKKRNAFINHLQLMQEIKLRFNALQRIAPTIPLAFAKSLTQTEVYLSVYKEEVRSSFGDNLDIHKGLIDTIISREKELSKDYYFFYHAHDRDLIVLHDFIKTLDKYLRLINIHDHFVPLRYKAIHTIGCNNVNEYLAAHSYIHDHNETTRSHMISVNVALFGNHWHPGECTFGYFVHNGGGCDLNGRLAPVFAHYNFNKKYIEKLTNLTSHLASSTGSLLQICVPKAMANDIVYLSKPYGVPYGNVESLNMPDEQTPIQAALEHMQKNPADISDLNEWQARLMFFDPMLDMDPAIKIFRYHTIPDEQIALYQKKLENIVIQILTDYILRDSVNIMSQMHHEPLFKLYGYMQQNN